jgi:hypothetical protein
MIGHGQQLTREATQPLPVGMNRIPVLILPDIRPIYNPDTGYPAGCPMQAGYRISTFKYLVKLYEINQGCGSGFT